MQDRAKHRKVINLTLDQPLGHYVLACKLISQEQWNKAIESLNNAINLANRLKWKGCEDKKWGFYLERATVLHSTAKNQEDYKAAIKDCDISIQVNNQYAHSYYIRGNCNYCIKEYDRAIEDFNEAIKLDPKDNEYRVALIKATYAQQTSKGEENLLPKKKKKKKKKKNKKNKNHEAEGTLSSSPKSNLSEKSSTATCIGLLSSAENNMDNNKESVIPAERSNVAMAQARENQEQECNNMEENEQAKFQLAMNLLNKIEARLSNAKAWEKEKRGEEKRRAKPR